MAFYKRTPVVIIVALFLLPMIYACTSNPSTGARQHLALTDPERLIPGVVCVVTHDPDQADGVESLATSIGYVQKKRRVLNGLGFVMMILQVPPGYSARQGIAELRLKFPKLVIDANHRYTLFSPEFGSENRDPRIYARRLIAWEQHAAHCGAGIRLGLVDTRINTEHPSLQGPKITTRSFLAPEAIGPPGHHGTSVAALLVGKPERTFDGLLPQSKLYAAEIFHQNDNEQIETTTWLIARALDWLVTRNVHVINLSFGGPQNALLALAVNRTLESNISLDAAAGHSRPLGGPTYPAAQEGVIAVTAIDAERRPYRHAAVGSYISLSAPGVDIWVPDANGRGHYTSGPSFAAPFVTATIASLRKKHPHWTLRQARQAVERAAVDLGNPGWDPVFGWGLVQAATPCP